MAEDTTGADLLDDIEAVFRKYTIQQSDHAYTALALYTAYTHFILCFDYAPRLLLTSAEKRSGKTRAATIASRLVNRPLIAANATPPAIFRSLSDADGNPTPRTLVFDEADTIFGTRVKAEQNEDLRGLINAGFQEGTPVLRVVGQDHHVEAFATFSPVIMCAIGKLPDTITDRAINLRLRRRKNSEKVSTYRIRRDEPALADLRERIEQWAETVRESLESLDPDNPLDDRAADVWEPLLAVAEVAGGHWPERGREAALHFAHEAAEADTEYSEGLELLSDIRQVLRLHKSHEITSKRLLELLTSLEESKWAEEGLTMRGLSVRLKDYEIHPGKVESGRGRGYKVAKFTDAFERYLPVPGDQVSEVSASAPRQAKNDSDEVSSNCPSSVQVSSRTDADTYRTLPESADSPGIAGNRTLWTDKGRLRTSPGIHGCHGCDEGTPTESRINQGVPYCNYCIERGRHQQNGDAA